MARRVLLWLLLCVALGGAPTGATAQHAAIPEIGFLAPGTRATMARFAAAFRRGLAGQGYIDGKSIRVDWRWMDEPGGESWDERVAALARPPVRLVVAPGLRAVQAVHRADPAMPIVMVAVGDPVASKLVPSLSHPGGVITGLTDYRADFPAQRLALLSQLSPPITRIAFLRNPAVASSQQTEAAAPALGLALLPLDLREPADLEPALARLADERVEALLVAPNPLSYANRARISAAAGERHLPVMFGYADFMDVDGLMSFGSDLEQLYVDAARYVRDILHGAKPGDLPILGPSRVELVVNLRNARALGIELPPALLAKADRLIR
jgi:putative ABC transport system substrate-binding protein